MSRRFQNVFAKKKLMLFTSVFFLSFLQFRWLMYTADAPALPGRPFIAVWNVKSSHKCQDKWNISIDLSPFDVVANENQSFHGQFMNTFYKDKLGLYPYVNDTTGEPVNGGLPQLANVTAHLEKSARDIIKYIPDVDYKGLAVLDWEMWRPLYARNTYRDKLLLHREMSEELVRQRHPTWPEDKVRHESRKEFESAARLFFESTVNLAKKLRPKAFWGFYHFPYCLNVHPHTVSGFDCKNKRLNDKISWLFDASSALYPSIYLPGIPLKTKHFVGYKVKEALRVARRGEFEIPVFPFVRYVYTRNPEYYLSEEDMATAVSVPAIMGASGLVFWGSGTDTDTKEKCINLKNYVENVLGPLVASVSNAATDCSQKRCSGQGRCAREFDPRKLTKFDLSAEDVRCKCYKGWTGQDCSRWTYV